MQAKQGSSFKESPGLRPGFQPWLPPSVLPPSPDRTWRLLHGGRAPSASSLLSYPLICPATCLRPDFSWPCRASNPSGSLSQHFWVTKLRQENHRNKGYLHIALHSLQPGFLFFLFFSSVHFSCSVVSDSLRPHGLQHNKPPCPSPIPRIYPNSCPLSQ